MNDLPPWEQQPDESPVWYERFHFFCLLPPERRSVIECYRLWRLHGRPMLGSGPMPKATPSGKRRYYCNGWKQHAKVWHWYERAQAWDAHVRSQFHQRYLDEILRARMQRLAGLLTYEQKLLQALERIDPKSISWAQITEGLQMVTEQLRLVCGDTLPPEEDGEAGRSASPTIRVIYQERQSATNMLSEA